MTEPRIHAGHIEVAVAQLIGWRRQTIVPNVSWGLGLLHEADLLVLDGDNRLTEIEIKVTLSDLKADLKKPHGHWSQIISRLVYAMPYNLIGHAEQLLSTNIGLIAIDWDNHLGPIHSQVDSGLQAQEKYEVGRRQNQKTFGSGLHENMVA